MDTEVCGGVKPVSEVDGSGECSPAKQPRVVQSGDNMNAAENVNPTDDVPDSANAAEETKQPEPTEEEQEEARKAAIRARLAKMGAVPMMGGGQRQPLHANNEQAEAKAPEKPTQDRVKKMGGVSMMPCMGELTRKISTKKKVPPPVAPKTKPPADPSASPIADVKPQHDDNVPNVADIDEFYSSSVSKKEENIIVCSSAFEAIQRTEERFDHSAAQTRRILGSQRKAKPSKLRRLSIEAFQDSVDSGSSATLEAAGKMEVSHSSDIVTDVPQSITPVFDVASSHGEFSPPTDSFVHVEVPPPAVPSVEIPPPSVTLRSSSMTSTKGAELMCPTPIEAPIPSAPSGHKSSDSDSLLSFDDEPKGRVDAHVSPIVEKPSWLSFDDEPKHIDVVAPILSAPSAEKSSNVDSLLSFEDEPKDRIDTRVAPSSHVDTLLSFDAEPIFQKSSEVAPGVKKSSDFDSLLTFEMEPKSCDAAHVPSAPIVKKSPYTDSLLSFDDEPKSSGFADIPSSRIVVEAPSHVDTMCTFGHKSSSSEVEQIPSDPVVEKSSNFDSLLSFECETGSSGVELESQPMNDVELTAKTQSDTSVSVSSSSPTDLLNRESSSVESEPVATFSRFDKSQAYKTELPVDFKPESNLSETRHRFDGVPAAKDESQHLPDVCSRENNLFDVTESNVSEPAVTCARVSPVELSVKDSKPEARWTSRDERDSNERSSPDVLSSCIATEASRLEADDSTTDKNIETPIVDIAVPLPAFTRMPSSDAVVLDSPVIVDVAVKLPAESEKSHKRKDIHAPSVFESSASIQTHDKSILSNDDTVQTDTTLMKSVGISDDRKQSPTKKADDPVWSEHSHKNSDDTLGEKVKDGEVKSEVSSKGSSHISDTTVATRTDDAHDRFELLQDKTGQIEIKIGLSDKTAAKEAQQNVKTSSCDVTLNDPIPKGSSGISGDYLHREVHVLHDNKEAASKKTEDLDQPERSSTKRHEEMNVKTKVSDSHAIPGDYLHREVHVMHDNKESASKKTEDLEQPERSSTKSNEEMNVKTKVSDSRAILGDYSHREVHVLRDQKESPSTKVEDLVQLEHSSAKSREDISVKSKDSNSVESKLKITDHYKFDTKKDTAAEHAVVVSSPSTTDSLVSTKEPSHRSADVSTAAKTDQTRKFELRQDKTGQIEIKVGIDKLKEADHHAEITNSRPDSPPPPLPTSEVPNDKSELEKQVEQVSLKSQPEPVKTDTRATKAVDGRGQSTVTPARDTRYGRYSMGNIMAQKSESHAVNGSDKSESVVKRGRTDLSVNTTSRISTPVQLTAGIRYLPPKTPPATKLPDARISPDSWRTKLKKVETKHEETTPAADEPADEIKTPRLKTLRVSIPPLRHVPSPVVDDLKSPPFMQEWERIQKQRQLKSPAMTTATPTMQSKSSEEKVPEFMKLAAKFRTRRGTIADAEAR